MIAAVAEPIIQTAPLGPAEESTTRLATAAERALQLENEGLRRLLHLKQRLIDLALRGEPPTTIVAQLETETGLEVRLLDPLLREVTGEPVEDADGWCLPQRLVRQVLTRFLGNQAATRFSQSRPRRPRLWYTIAPVLSNEVTLGYIALQEDPELEESSFDEAGLLALANYAAIACSLPLGNEHVRREIVDETKTGFLRELLNDDFSHTRAASQAGKIGFNNDLPHRVVVACPLVCGKTNDTPLLNAPARQRVLDVAARVFHRLAPQALLLVEEDHLTVILEEDSEETRRQALSEVRRLFDKVDLSLGASSSVKDAAELPRAYQEALKACQAGMTFANLRRGDMLSFERLGFYGLLTQVSSGNGELTSFVEDVLGPLVDYDRTRKRTLLMTVRSFLANHGSLVRTCEDLRIQPSTLTYRIQRIKTIGNLDLYSIDDMLLAQAAMLIWDGGLDSELRDSLAKRSKSGRGAGRKLALASSFI